MSDTTEQFLTAIELHRQRDLLESALRQIVDALELSTANPLVATLRLTAGFANAKLLLMEISNEGVAGS